MALNLFLSNALTFRFARMRGAQVVTDLLPFCVVCAMALVAQLAVATSLQQFGVQRIPATFGGIVIGSVWNYTVAARPVWLVHGRRTVSSRRASALPVIGARGVGH